MHTIPFFTLISKLKTTKRHSWPSGISGPQETVADHSWRLIMMVMLYADKLDTKVDILKSMQMAAIHDLPEAITGDIPIIYQTQQTKQQKQENEMKAMYQIVDLLPPQEKDQLMKLYQEYEEQQCLEAKFVKALDKIEAFQQHNIDPLDTWVEKEKLMLFQNQYLIQYCQFDQFLLSLANSVIQEGIQKLEQANENIDEIKKKALEFQ